MTTVAVSIFRFCPVPAHSRKKQGIPVTTNVPESLPTEKYLSYFYPFDELDFRKNGVASGWSVTDREGIAITMAMGNAPQAVAMELQKKYAERYDWIVKEFTDFSFPLSAAYPPPTG